MLDQSLAGRVRESGESLSFLKGKKGDGITDTVLDEAVAEWMEVETLRTRNGESSNLKSIINENFGAIAGSKGTMGKMKAFARAMKKFFEVALMRNLYIKKAIRDGVVDKKDIESFRAKLQGTSQQEEHMQEVGAEYKDRYESDFVPTENEPFSLGEAVTLTDEQYAKAVEDAFAKAEETRNVNTDDVREFIPGYNEANRLTRDAQFHSIASKINKEVLNRMLAKPTEFGTVRLLAGGGGSGKGTADGLVKKDVDFTIDTTMSGKKDLAWYDTKVGEDRLVVPVYVFTSFENAFPRIISRSQGENDPRIVPLEVAVEAHVGAQQNILKEGSSEGIFIVDNNGARGEQKLIDFEKLQEYNYLDGKSKTYINRGAEKADEGDSSGNRRGNESQITEAEARARLTQRGEEILTELYQEGKLSQEEVSAFLQRPFTPNEASLSLGNSAIADALIGDVTKRVRNPLERAEVLGKIAKNVKSLKREADEHGVAFGKAFVKPALVEPRTKKSLKKESAMRQALREEELVNEAMAQSDFALDRDQDFETKILSMPVHGYLSNGKLTGSLMSESEALKSVPDFQEDSSIRALYDDKVLVSPTIFGGSMRPDEVAKELFDMGTYGLRDDSVQELWRVLNQEVEAVEITSCFADWAFLRV